VARGFKNLFLRAGPAARGSATRFQEFSDEPSLFNTEPEVADPEGGRGTDRCGWRSVRSPIPGHGHCRRSRFPLGSQVRSARSGSQLPLSQWQLSQWQLSPWQLSPWPLSQRRPRRRPGTRGNSPPCDPAGVRFVPTGWSTATRRVLSARSWACDAPAGQAWAHGGAGLSALASPTRPATARPQHRLDPVTAPGVIPRAPRD
jgi:hypothetical protein